MKAIAQRVFDFFFLHLDLEVGCGLVAAFVGAHWLFWRTFDLPPYRILVALTRGAHCGGEYFWGIPLVLLGSSQMLAVWFRRLTARRVICRLHAMWLMLIGVMMIATVSRSIVAWFMLLGVYAQLSVFFQLPHPKSYDRSRLYCSVLPALALTLLAEGFDKESITYLGVAAAVAIATIPALDTLRKWIQGNKREDVHLRAPQPLVVSAQPVFASVELVSKVDQELKASVAKLETYVHESVHKQGLEIQAVVTLIKDSDESHREAIESVNQQGEARITKVHDRLNVMDRNLGGLESSAKSTADGVVRLQQSMENILGRLPPRRGGAS